jgi:RimJ/RimL family protein N-acetyltransferase
MVKILADRLQGKIRAEIKQGNIASVKIAEYAGMTFKEEENRVLHYSNY